MNRRPKEPRRRTFLGNQGLLVAEASVAHYGSWFAIAGGRDGGVTLDTPEEAACLIAQLRWWIAEHRKASKRWAREAKKARRTGSAS